MGVFEGVTGVAVKPVQGAMEKGVGGFFQGVGKGVVGLVARPTGGLVDFASGLGQAIPVRYRHIAHLFFFFRIQTALQRVRIKDFAIIVI